MRSLLPIVLVAVAAVLIDFVSPVTASGQASSTTLTRGERKAIIHSPHPFVRKDCPGPIDVVGARRSTLGTRRVIVAQVECRQGTTGVPVETGVYGRRGKWKQLYRLDSGRSIERGRVAIGALESFSAHHHRVLLRYGGYTRRDPMCCPSRTYHRIFHIYWTRFTRGRVVRDS